MSRTLFFLRKPFGVRSIQQLAFRTACFHTCSQLRRFPTSEQLPVENLDDSSTSSLFPLPKQVSLYAYNVQDTKYRDILEALETFHNSSLGKKDEQETGQMAVVILATPSFASWLEDSSPFVQQVLGRLAGSSVSSRRVKKNVDVVCACVDGLAPQPPRIPLQRGRPPTEGLAFLYGQRDLVLPNWKRDDSLSSQDPSLQSSITFSKKATSSKPFDVTVPLATTLFTNGRHSTLLVSRWTQVSEMGFVQTKNSSSRSNVAVQILDSKSERLPESYIPSVALTPARQIMSGLGNIIRRLDFGDNGIGPASQELETVVAAELKGRPGMKLDIWAMIIPSRAVTRNLEESEHYFALATTPAKVVERKRTSGVPDYPYVGYWLNEGAILCRVLSGGGGWGAKQGLLSLDPQTTYDRIDEARFDFSEGSLEDQQASALGTLAKKGDYVQFFTAKTKAVPTHKQGRLNAYMQGSKDLEVKDPTSTVFGTTPSTRDQLPVAQRTMGAKDRKVPISIRRNHFGCVTESGLFLRRTFEVHDTWITKIDLPYSDLYFREAHSRSLPVRLFDPHGSPKFGRNGDLSVEEFGEK